MGEDGKREETHQLEKGKGILQKRGNRV